MAAFDPLEVCIVAESESGSLFGFRLKESHRIIEFSGSKEHKTDLPVGEVFNRKIQDLLNKYGKRRFAEIVRGPEPFTEVELGVVEALRKYQIEVQPVGNQFQFNIKNNSSLALEYITLGAIVIRQRIVGSEKSIPYWGDGRLWLDVSGIMPGQSAIRFQSCYHSIADPKDIQIYRLYPSPEDRRYFKEFPEHFQFGK